MIKVFSDTSKRMKRIHLACIYYKKTDTFSMTIHWIQVLVAIYLKKTFKQ